MLSAAASVPFKVMRSFAAARMVVCVPSVPSEMERLPFTGRLSARSRLPQYLARAMLAGA